MKLSATSVSIQTKQKQQQQQQTLSWNFPEFQGKKQKISTRRAAFIALQG